MSNVLILGYRGFLGSHLKDFHINKGDFVYGISSTYDCSQDSENFKAIDYDLHFMKGDIEAIDKEVDYIYNFAWSGVAKNKDDFDLQFNNLNMSCNCVKLAQKIKCKRIIFASSICEMEVIEDLFLINESYLHNNQLYGITKLSSRLYSQVLSYENNIEFIPLIISNVYGIGENSERLVNSTLKKIIKKEHLAFSEGVQMYDFIYIDDAIKKIALVAEKGENNNQYYIGSKNPKPLKDFLLEIINITDKDADYCFGEFKTSSKGVDYNKFDLSKIERELGYRNVYNFKEGILKTYGWLKEKSLNGKFQD